MFSVARITGVANLPLRMWSSSEKHQLLLTWAPGPGVEPGSRGHEADALPLSYPHIPSCPLLFLFSFPLPFIFLCLFFLFPPVPLLFTSSSLTFLFFLFSFLLSLFSSFSFSSLLPVTFPSFSLYFFFLLFLFSFPHNVIMEWRHFFLC